jgi:hypothetical protein
VTTTVMAARSLPCSDPRSDDVLAACSLPCSDPASAVPNPGHQRSRPARPPTPSPPSQGKGRECSKQGRVEQPSQSLRDGLRTLLEASLLCSTGAPSLVLHMPFLQMHVRVVAGDSLTPLHHTTALLYIRVQVQRLEW